MTGINKNNTKGGLTPCPFCGGNNIKIKKWREDLYSVYCKCGCESPRDSKSASGAKRIWNRRRYYNFTINV